VDVRLLHLNKPVSRSLRPKFSWTVV